MLLAILGHIDAHHGGFIVEQEVCQRLGQLGLAHARGAEEQERASRPVRICHTCASTANRIRYSRDRLGLSHHAAGQHQFHVEQLLGLALQHFACRNAGPRADHISDGVWRDLLGQHHLALILGHGFFGFAEFLFDVRNPSVTQFCNLGEVAFPLRDFRLAAQFIQLLLVRAEAIDAALFVFPAGGERGELLLLIGQLGAQAHQAILRGSVLLLGQCHLFDLHAAHDALHAVDLLWARVDLHAQSGGGLVDEVDGLIRQEAAGDVAIRQGGGGDQRGVLNADAVVHLVALLESAQDAHRVLHGWLAHVDLLEATLQCGILFDVLAVLVQGGGTDQAQLTSGQQRLDHVACVHGRIATGACAHNGMQLIDEGDDLPFGLLDLVEDSLEALLKLASILRAGQHGTQIQRNELLATQGLRHVASHDAAGKPLHDGRLSDARLADKNWVVLGTAGQYLHHATDFLITADDRINLSLTCTGG